MFKLLGSIKLWISHNLEHINSSLQTLETILTSSSKVNLVILLVARPAGTQLRKQTSYSQTILFTLALLIVWWQLALNS